MKQCFESEIVFRRAEPMSTRFVFSYLYGLFLGLAFSLPILISLPKHSNFPKELVFVITAFGPGAIAFGVPFFLLRKHSLTISLDRIDIGRVIAPITIYIQDLRAVIGFISVDMSGGEMLIWKRLLLVTDSKVYVLKEEPEDIPQIFEFLGICATQAACIPPNGNCAIRSSLLSNSWVQVRRRLLFSILARGVIGISLSLGMSFICLLILVDLQSPRNGRPIEPINPYPLIVPLIAGIVTVVSTFIQIDLYFRMRKLVKASENGSFSDFG